MTYRRPRAKTIVLAAVIATFGSALLAFSRPVQMVVDGQTIPSDVPPVSTAHEVYVPVRTLGDALGAQTLVSTHSIDVVRGNQSLRIHVGDVHATIDGMPFTLARAPFRVRGRVMVGLRAVARAFGVHASYDARTARIDVMTPGIGQAGPASSPRTQ
jgi:hypothetical protein